MLKFPNLELQSVDGTKSGMKLSVVSKDRELFQMCREIVLEERLSAALELALVNPDSSPEESDVYIWDVQRAQRFPRGYDSLNLRRHFFVIDREDVPSFLEQANSQVPNLLLKPVTRSTLRAFVSGTLVSNQESLQPKASALKDDRNQILQSLVEANLKLQTYDQERTTFLGRIAHDFRAPLQAMTGYCKLLLDGQIGKMTLEQREVIRCLEHSSRRMARMAESMMRLSVGQRCQSQPALEPGDIVACVMQAARELRPFAQAKQIDIRVDMDAPAGSLHFERPSIEQVLLNLLDNACKFTPRLGSIEVTGRSVFWERRRAALSTSGVHRDERRYETNPAPNGYRIDVVDSGPGVPPDKLEAVFEEFTRTNSGDRPGCGLGLAISRLIVRRHRGGLWAENRGSQAVFSLVLPFRLADTKLTTAASQSFCEAGVGASK